MTYVAAFLKAMGEIYEVVIFTASLSKYADPVLDQLDIHRVVKHRLFRESCYNNKGNYVKVGILLRAVERVETDNLD
jgi:RNA polymerase II subunit A small phosphatase-like protein